MRELRWVFWAAAAVVAAAVFVAAALRPFGAPPGPDQQVMAIAADLRCPVCTGESAAAADNAQSAAMRAQIAADLQAGMTKGQILHQFVVQYGQWILYQPPARGALALLWGVPVAAVAAAGALVWRQSAVRKVAAARDRDPRGLDDGNGGEPDPALTRRLTRFL